MLIGDHVESAGLPAATCAQNPTSKKLPETDDIFANLRQVHTQAANDLDTLRISIDTKAQVKIGAFSRHGLARAAAAVQAADHDMDPAAVLAPAGILEVLQDQLQIVFGTSRDTSDFVEDALQLRRKERSHPTWSLGRFGWMRRQRLQLG